MPRDAYTTVAQGMPFDNSNNDFLDNTVQTVIENIRIVNNTVSTDVVIPTGHTMIHANLNLTGTITIEGTGELILL